MSFFGAVMIIAVVIVRAAAIEKLPKRVFLLLWELVLLRLLLPFSVPSILSAYSFVGRSKPMQEVLEQKPEVNIFLQAKPGQINAGTIEALPENEAGLSLWFLIWLTGMVLCAAFFAISYLRCYTRFRSALPVDNGFTVQWLKEHRLRRPVRIRQTDQILSPLTYGIFRPVILMPKGTDWENRQQLKYVLLHEYIHICRFDMVVKLFAVIALCIHWFNPFVWLMYLLFNRDIELACDECVVRRLGEALRSAYARTLIGMEEKKSGITPLYNNFSKNAIEERIRAIMKTEKITRGILLVSVIVVISIVVLFATSAESVSRQTETGNKAVALPEKELMDELVGSIAYSEGKVSFRIPEGDNQWHIFISGRIEAEGFGGMSAHYLPEESESNSWEGGKTYSFDVSGGGYTELGMDIWLGEGEPRLTEVKMNLLEFLPQNLLAAEYDADRGMAVGGIHVPDVVLETAKQLVDQKYMSMQEGYSNWRIQSLVHAYTYDDIGGMTLEVYRLNYEFLAHEPEKITLAGGMTVDEEGWVAPEYADSTFLIFHRSKNLLSYLDYLVENDCMPGDEVFTNDLIQQLGIEAKKGSVAGKAEVREKTGIIQCMIEGMAEEMPATLYVGDGFSIYIPDEGWQIEDENLEEPVKMKASFGSQVSLWVEHYEKNSLAVEEQFLQEGYAYVGDRGKLQKAEGGVLLEARILGREEETWVVCDRYPETSEYMEGAAVRLAAVGKTFGVMVE